ncbi:E3 ubiquitin-protein ligase TRIM63-like [Ostrea edulis]|uniref:E3 ubiquitin-protein ligase TRIM63-like n=1 Tax=Ostrea edulis TaxID=37623 RepID=UPI0024AFED1D|nr:E3 ubiquitin-protein ligase TRIM63-like [Ostrea edulis]
MNITPRIGRENMCSTHQDRKLELFCNDHEEPCCAMCVSTVHRTCESVDAIQKTAETLIEILSHNFDSLSEDIHILENKLVDAKKEQERFVTEMDAKADQITENTTREIRVAINHLQYLKNEYLTKMPTAGKRNKEKY